MSKCELLLAGILPHESQLPSVIAELKELGLEIHPHWWGAHQAVSSHKGVILAIEYPGGMKEDILTARIRAILNRNPGLSGRTEIRVHRRYGWGYAEIECYAHLRNRVAA